jgi:hypothetical protein
MYYVHEWFSHTHLILGKVEGLFEKCYFALSWDSRWVLWVGPGHADYC